MKHHHRGRGRAHGSCRESAESLFEEALFARESNGSPRGGVDRKTLQLCRQVERALSLALSGECRDDLLREIYVESVVALGSASQLLVRVIIPAGLPPGEVMERLALQTPHLRSLMARAICRKKVPTLCFVPSSPASKGESDAL